MKKTLLISSLGFMFAACNSQTGQVAPSEIQDDSQAQEQAVATEGGAVSDNTSDRNISLTEIAEHAVEADCWMAIDGAVYDVTGFIASGNHGGGEAILQGCGKDATELFDTRPMGSGTPHSSKARGFLPGFKIGDLAQ
jgi:cytochrome b involved in lipid metabolism